MTARILLLGLAATLLACESEVRTAQPPNPTKADAAVIAPTDAGFIDVGSLPQNCRPQPWKSELVMDGFDGASDKVSIAVSQEGAIYLSFDNDQRAWFAERTKDSGWTNQALDRAVNRSTTMSSLALDTQGNPHIIYGQNTRNQRLEIKHHWRVDGQWSSEVVDISGGRTSIHPRYLIDKRDKQHLTFYKKGTIELYYASKSPGEAWQVNRRAARSVNQGASFAIDSQDVLHMTLEDPRDDNLGYANLRDGVWTEEIVDESPQFVYASDIFLDGDDQPVIAYAHNDASELRLARKKNNKWELEVVNQEKVYVLDALIDEEQTTHLFYVLPLDNQIVHVSRRLEDSAWQTTQVASTVRHASLASASTGAGTLHLVYFLYQERELHYAVRECL